MGAKKKKLGKIERRAVGKEIYLKVDFSAIQLWGEKQTYRYRIKG